VNDDGRVFVVNGGMCHLAAALVAGAMRDQSIEAEIIDGWNYLPRLPPAPWANRPRAVTRGVRAKQQQAVAPMRQPPRRHGGISWSGTATSQAARVVPRLLK